MREEETVRLDWESGEFENDNMQCATCGDKNAWDGTHACCSDQCKGVLNALQAFPFAAWGDISGAALDPHEVSKARRLEIEYAEKKPVWTKMARHVAKADGWEIIKSCWIDIDKGG